MLLNTQYKAFWDDVEKAVAIIPIYSAGGGFGTFNKTLAIREQENGLYHVVTVDFFDSHGPTFWVEDYFINTVRKNADGSFAMISKQSVDINEISFTDEELDEIRAAFPVEYTEWDRPVLIGDRFVLSYTQLREIAAGLNMGDVSYSNYRVVDGVHYLQIGFNREGEGAVWWFLDILRGEVFVFD